jgi:hypothetical protein
MAALTLWRALLFPSPVPPPAVTTHGDAACMAPIYAELQPLVGGPAWLPLHVALLCGDGEDAVQYDFLPQSPSASTTAATLLTGGGVAGVVRCRPRPSRARAVPQRSVLLGHTKKSQDALAEYAEAQPRQLRLLRNDCWTFAACVASHALDDNGA